MLARAHKFIVGLLITVTKIGNQFSKFLRNYSASSPISKMTLVSPIFFMLYPYV